MGKRVEELDMRCSTFVENYVEDHLEDIMLKVDDTLPEWFSQYIDYSGVELHLHKQAEEAYKDMVDAKSVSDWEEQQYALKKQCDGW